MGASVGVGGLIVGISMLVVFSMAYQSITMQIDSGLERIENADDPIPTFTLDDAELWEGAVVDISITGAGAGYTDGTFAASSGTGGLQGTFTTNSGSITSMVITSHGNYSSAPTLQLTCNVACTPTSTATFTVTLGNVIYANLTNTGSVTVPHDDMWLFVDGNNATTFSSVYTSSISSENWYSGETVELVWWNASVSGDQRLSLTAGPLSVSTVLG
ncbi:MAG: hypothetical protein DWC10_07055 [Candidatus Poseidoniales archaeon]|nr:hypothetical protein [Euryarchaeota archaeon]RJU96108.1 MAG: hypothetical protein DWC10_07055 [Candidatus Poseidoniales archaeon]